MASRRGASRVLLLGAALLAAAGCRDWGVTWGGLSDAGAGDTAIDAATEGGTSSDGPAPDGPLPDGPAPDGPRPDGPPADGGPCSDQSLPSVPTFGPAVFLTDVNGTANESFGPTVTGDGLEMLFTSLRTSTDYDLYLATRATTADEFGGVTYVSALSDFGKDVHPTITEDGLTIIFSSARPNAYGGLDLFQAIRTTRTGSWSSPTTITALASEDDDYNPSMLGSGQRIIFSRSPLGGGQSTLWEAIYVAVAWGTPAHRAELDSPGLNEAPALFPDGRALLFASDRESTGVTHLFVARRPTIDDAFVCIERAAGLWVDGKADSDPFVTRDASELYFASRRADGNWKVHRSLVY